MLESDAEREPAPPVMPLTRCLPPPRPANAPDRDVLDSARFRLAFQEAVSAAGPRTERAQADLRSIDTVLETARANPLRPADSLDVGAALVLLSNLRLYLDQLEAGLLATAQHTGMSWDLVAAIIGMPADEARDRLRALRARPDPL
jgi:hypothetical protein